MALIEVKYRQEPVPYRRVGGHTLRAFPESRELMATIYGEERLAAVERGEIV